MTDVWDEIDWTDPDKRDQALERLAADIGAAVHPGPELSHSEKRALVCASHGLTAQMTAELLFLSEETIKTQLLTARGKLRAKNTLHAVALAIRAGLIP